MSSVVLEHDQIVTLLQEKLGNAVVCDSSVLERARSDKSGKVSSGLPICVIEVTSTADVSEVLKIANATNTPVVVRGGGSGLAGGAIAGPGEISLSLEKMNRILEISVKDRFASVEAGVINNDLNEMAKKQNLWFTPDPASRAWSTIGGNIATNAGGLLCVKYGGTREVILELTVVLANGEIMTLGHKSIKGVTGYDLVSLFVGSEGTLGVITEAREKLRPVDKNPVWSISAVAENISDAIEAAQDTISNYLQPSILELIDNRAARHIAKYLELDFIKEDSAILIAQTDGPGSNSEALAIKQIWEKCGLTVEIETGREDLIQFRRSMHPALEKQGNVLIEDIAVPVSQLGKMFLEIRNIEHEFGIEIPTVAHAGDGNLHPNFIYSGSTVPEEIWLAADMMFKKALELGGTLTGEHGVGELKRHWLAVELGQSQFELQKKIKSIFDPKGLLNPGKVFEN